MSHVDLIPVSGRTWLARRDPRLKLFWLAAVSLASVLVDAPVALAGLCAATFLIAVGQGWTRGTWLFVAGILVAIAWGTMLSQAMFFRPAPETRPLVTLVPTIAMPWYTFPGIALYREGALYGLLQSLRIVAVTLTGLTVCLSTSPERLLAALVWLRVPAAVSFMAVAALRFLPTIIDQWTLVRAACRLRGYRPRLWNPGRAGWASWRTEAALLVPVIAASLRGAGTLATSLTARGFDATRPRTLYPPLAMTWVERGLAALLAAVCICLSTIKSLSWLAVGGTLQSAVLEPWFEFTTRWL